MSSSKEKNKKNNKDKNSRNNYQNKEIYSSRNRNLK